MTGAGAVNPFIASIDRGFTCLIRCEEGFAMRANIRLFLVIAGFCIFVDTAYIVWNIAYDSQNLATDPSGGERSVVEWVGTIALGLVAVLALLIAFYLNRTRRAQGGELPEDRLDAQIDDGDAEQGFYSPWSWWPVALAGAAALLFLGVAIGAWIAIIGVTAGILALIGWTYEYHRGHFGH